MVARKEYSDVNMQGNSLTNFVFAAGSVSMSWLATDPLARANHTGTQTASTISDFAATAQGYRLDQFAAPNIDLSINSHKLTNVSTPTTANDAATKSYVDNLVNGTPWVSVPVIVVSTANLTLSGEQTIDGVTTSASLVLLTGQSTASQNGLYVTAAGAWARSVHMAAGADAANYCMFIEKGTTYADTQWRCTSDTGSAVVGTNSLTFTQFAAGVTYAADGSTLQLIGSTFSVKSGGITNTQLAAGAALANIGAGGLADSYLASTFMKRYAANFGDGAATSFAITHSLGTKDVHVSVRLNSTDEEVICYWVATSTTVVTITVNGTAPAANALRVVVMG